MRCPSAGLTTTTLSPSMPCPCRFVSTATRISCVFFSEKGVGSRAISLVRCKGQGAQAKASPHTKEKEKTVTRRRYETPRTCVRPTKKPWWVKAHQRRADHHLRRNTQADHHLRRNTQADHHLASRYTHTVRLNPSLKPNQTSKYSKMCTTASANETPVKAGENSTL